MSQLHPATANLLRYFAYDHLPEGHLRETSQILATTAGRMVSRLPEGPELTAGLRHLLEAKDCFVRAALDIQSEEVSQ